MERRHADESGNAGISQPSSIESPEIEAIIVEWYRSGRAVRSQRGSEGSLAATIPAIANAIYDAVGVRLHESPFTPERVLAALRAEESGCQARLI